MTNKIILITGGSRSGKSEFAERLAGTLGGKCAYIATAQANDEEMRSRVEKHRERRKGAFWLNYEAPFNAAGVISSVSGADSILFDCVTLYISNILYGTPAAPTMPGNCAEVLPAVDELLAAARNSGKHVLFVTNELGGGIVPDNAVAREFRDLAGLVNQKIAQAADEVYFVVCGIAVELKVLAAELRGGGVK